MILFPLFHWSPTERREKIRVEGLRPYSDPVISSNGHTYPYVSLSLSPSRAWGLSGDMEWVQEIEAWDLWQVGIPDNAEVRINPFWGQSIEEIRVYSVIPADKVWWVAQRVEQVAVPLLDSERENTDA